MEHFKNKSLENIVEVIDGIETHEEWRDIKNYEGKYQVSSFGRIKSLKRTIQCLNGVRTPIRERIRTQFVTPKGYATIMLPYRNRYFVHRLVAFAFFENPQNKPQINHINADKLNNTIQNLEWVTGEENLKHAKALGLLSKHINKKNNYFFKISKKVIDQKGTIYESIKKAYDTVMPKCSLRKLQYHLKTHGVYQEVEFTIKMLNTESVDYSPLYTKPPLQKSPLRLV